MDDSAINEEQRPPLPPVTLRDGKGRYLPGVPRPDRRKRPLKQFPGPAKIQRKPDPIKNATAIQLLKEQLRECINPEQWQKAIFALWKLTQPGKHGAEIQVKAFDTLCAYLLGKPGQQIAVQQELTTTQTTVNVDIYKNMAEDDLREVIARMEKYQSKEALPEITVVKGDNGE